MKRNLYRALIALLIAGGFIGPIIATVQANVVPSNSPAIKILIFIDPANTSFKDRIELDNTLQISYATSSNYYGYLASLSDYDIFLVNGFLPSNTTFIAAMTNEIQSGTGLFIFGGYYPLIAETRSYGAYADFTNILPVVFNYPYTTEVELYIDQDYVGQIELRVNDEYLYSDTSPASSVNVLQRSVVWESSPLVKERIFVKDAKAGANVLVYRPEQNRVGNFTKGEPLVAYTTYGSGRILWVSMCVGFMAAQFNQYIVSGIGPYWNRTIAPGTTPVVHPVKRENAELNKPFYLWPYFNFFTYQSSKFIAGLNASQIDTYSQWPYSPIPHETEATLWMIFVAGLWVFNFVLFFSLGRKKKGQREPIPPGTAGEKELTAEERKAMEDKRNKNVVENPEEKKMTDVKSEEKKSAETSPEKKAEGDTK